MVEAIHLALDDLEIGLYSAVVVSMMAALVGAVYRKYVKA